ncbi:hypothetical protein [Ekhidna sp. To15]|uniref:tetratricopeptide repeat protein n=1 Tax=Ekhidna sp. To15 TaxID=3395267 RepID=UPI003F522BFE
MRGSCFIFILMLLGCGSPSQDKIIVPKLHAGFYADALERINKEIKSAPGDARLIDQKLFYCEQLEWPTTCISALDAYQEANGMTNQLVEQYIMYYKTHERYQLLLEVIDKWGEEYDLGSKFIETYIDGLARLGRRASVTIELKEYLKTNQSKEALTFASAQYLKIRDTTMAAYNLSKLHVLDNSHELMWDYGKILVTLGYYDRGFDVMAQFVDEHPDDYKIQLAYAKLLEQAGRNKDARIVLKPFIERDTIAYLLANWYQKDLMWDSASYVLTSLTTNDSTERKPIWKLGRLYEDRGWYLSSLPYFEYLIELNPNDTLAQQRMDLIQRKIAYLQRLKFEESKIPTIELQPKKIEN